MTAPAPAAPAATTGQDLHALGDAWRARWPEALALWSPFTRLHDPTFFTTPRQEADAGLTGSFAMIRLADQTVVVSLRQVAQAGLDAFALEVLAHEVGHHILCPADLRDNARMLARVRRGLPTLEHLAPMVANLFADLLINDRLQRTRGLDMAGVYRALGPADEPFWAFYLRLFEVLWSLPTGELTGTDVRASLPAEDLERIDLDAVLGARLVRTFAGRWLDGSGRFAALCLPHLLAAVGEDPSADPRIGSAVGRLLDAVAAGAGGQPDGLTEVDPEEGTPPVHPAFDPELTGDTLVGDQRGDGRGTPPEEQPGGEADAVRGQYREPFEYGALLRATGLDLDDHEVAVRYYRERAAGHLLPFPTREVPAAVDPLPEGVETWDVGSPLADIDWTESVLRSPVVIPGTTTVQRVWGSTEGATPHRVPVDLDLYVDSSGSMPDPQQRVSYLTLAGAIVALSALRAGASVQVTLWSGAQQYTTTRGFVRDEHAILAVLTDFFGGGTAFPIHVLRDTYAGRRPEAAPAHVLVISDDGVTTMFDRDERGRDGREVSRMAIEAAGGGATMVLNLWQPVDRIPGLPEAAADGWDIHTVTSWDDLVAFARAFSRRHYDPTGPRP